MSAQFSPPLSISVPESVSLTASAGAEGRRGGNKRGQEDRGQVFLHFFVSIF